VRAWTNFVGAVVEAWQELRIHRGRVLLSLIGVAVAVCAITSVVGLGAIAEEASRESNEASGGRPADLSIVVNSTTDGGAAATGVDAAVSTIAKRYRIRYSTHVENANVNVGFPDGEQDIQANIVDPDFATMHRLRMEYGSWFVASDAQRLAPAVVVNSGMYKAMGSPQLSSHPTIALIGATSTVGVVIGVYQQPGQDDYSTMYILPQGYALFADSGMLRTIPPQYELWVPPAIAPALASGIQSQLEKQFGSGYQVNVSRQDYRAFGGPDPLLIVKLVVGGIAGLVLLLGALGLVNISLVTVRQRVREIGIRRSFGASAGRVFFSVMMESVVATVAAGVAGVALAVLLVENPLSQHYLAMTIIDVPSFPIGAAITGLLCATGVGALAGLLPALVAIRVKVIDAIRF
jgi:putative ABC transport system permease protein